MSNNYILVINGGSSSFKYQVLDMKEESMLCQGLVERIGSPESVLTHKSFPDTDKEKKYVYPGNYFNHAEGMKKVAEVLLDASLGGVLSSKDEICAVGHRVLLGGPEYSEVKVDEKIKEVIRSYIPLGPLHNPANLAGIEVIEEIFPGVPNVAVFDTGFHATLPEEAFTYAIPQDLAKKHRIRRYGFHGTSHRFVSHEAAKLAGKKPEEFNVISCHLGNGCSICAVKNGKSVDTSMGLTPLEGLVMGTRSGSIDPAILTYLMEEEGMNAADMNKLLNHQSGLKGLFGSNDMRDIESACDNGDAAANLAFKVFVYSIRKCIGSYYPVLGRVDAILFTGGIGENSDKVRAAVCEGMDSLGVSLDLVKNEGRFSKPVDLSQPGSKTSVFVIPTNEELEIARSTMRVLGMK